MTVTSDYYPDLTDVGQLPDVDQGDEPDVDPEAPYGRKADGTPRLKPGPPKGVGGRQTPPPRVRRRSSRVRSSSARPAASPRASSSTTPTVDETLLKGAQTLLGIPTRALATAGLVVGLAGSTLPDKVTAGGQVVDNPRKQQLGGLALALSADAATLILHGDGLAAGAAGLAESLPWLAGVFSKAAQVGPYAAAIEVGASVVLQMLCNHGILPATPMLGTINPGTLVTQVMGDGS
jgi:hypothetical protein